MSTTCVCNPAHGGSNLTAVNQTLTDGPKRVQDYWEFFWLIGINVLALAGAVYHFYYQRSRLNRTKQECADEVLAGYVTEVDYPFVRYRLDWEHNSEFVLHVAEFIDEHEEETGRPASGQQIEDVTLAKVLFKKNRWKFQCCSSRLP